MNYFVVFDTRQLDYLTPGLAATGLIVFLTAVLVVLAHRELAGRAAVVFRWLVPALVGLGLAMTWIPIWREYSSAAAALDEGRASAVQGYVSNFKAWTYRGHAWERFCVEDQCFQYSDSDASAGLTTKSHQGSIKSGLPVRVTFVGNVILKLEIAH